MGKPCPASLFSSLVGILPFRKNVVWTTLKYPGRQILIDKGVGKA